jgi:hypothetical protein
MASFLKILKSEKSKNRKLPFLPRVGLVVDAFGRQFIFKGVPFAETLFIARERGISFESLRKVALEQLNEVKLPSFGQIVPIKKPAPKAAATPKKKAPKAAKPVQSVDTPSAD